MKVKQFLVLLCVLVLGFPPLPAFSQSSYFQGPSNSTSFTGTLGTSQGGTGAVTTTDARTGLHVGAYVDVRDSINGPGAVCDGSANDTAAIDRAAVKATALAQPMSTGGLLCGYSGNFSWPAAVCELRSFNLIQLAPNTPTGVAATASARTITRTAQGSCTSLLLDQVSVNRNGATTDCNITDCAGIWLANLTNLTARRLDVTGNGLGTGVIIVDCINVQFDDNYIHDMQFGAGSNPGSEQLVGLRLARNTNIRGRNNRIINITSNIAGTVRAFQTDLFDPTGNNGLLFTDTYLENGGEGIDVSSSDIAINTWFYNTHYKNIDGNAEKWGSAKFSGSIGSVVQNAGLGGFVVYTNSVNVTATTSLRITDATASGIGYNGLWPSPIGFNLQNTTSPAPVDTQCIRCSAIDTGTGATASFTGAISGTTLTTSAVTGTIAVGQSINSGAGVADNTVILAQLTGPAGGAGTYTVSRSQTISSEVMTSIGNTMRYGFQSESGVAWARLDGNQSIGHVTAYAHMFGSDLTSLGPDVTSTSTLSKTDATLDTNIPGLTMPLGLGSYNCAGHLVISANASGGAKMAMFGTGGLVASSSSLRAVSWSGTTLSANTTITLGNGMGGATAAVTDIDYSAALVVTTPGLIIVRAAQNATFATPTVVGTNSTLSCRPV